MVIMYLYILYTYIEFGYEQNWISAPSTAETATYLYSTSIYYKKIELY